MFAVDSQLYNLLDFPASLCELPYLSCKGCGAQSLLQKGNPASWEWEPGVGKADSGEEFASNYLRVNRFKPNFQKRQFSAMRMGQTGSSKVIKPLGVFHVHLLS